MKITNKTLRAVCTEANATVLRSLPFGILVEFRPGLNNYMAVLVPRRPGAPRKQLCKEALSAREMFWFLDGFIQAAAELDAARAF